MTGDDRIRHCARCDKAVHDLSAMTADQVRALSARSAPWCGRIAVGVGLALATAGCSVICLPHHDHAAARPEPEPVAAPTPVVDLSDDDPALYMMGEIDVPVNDDATESAKP